MKWKCPACETSIRHAETETEPRIGRIYRCHICRLELVVDPDRHRLIVAPLPTDDSR